MIELNTIPAHRDGILITITDGQPSAGQSPCPLADEITSGRYLSTVVGVGKEVYDSLAEVSCLATDESLVFYIETYNQLIELLEPLLGSILCEEASPLEGHYARVPPPGGWVNGRVLFKHW